MSEREKRRLRVGELPANPSEGFDTPERDQVVRDALGEHIFSDFLRNTREEWHRYICTVQERERERSLEEYQTAHLPPRTPECRLSTVAAWFSAHPEAAGRLPHPSSFH